MAISKKGLRKIIVNDLKYYWKFNDKIIIIADKYSKQQLIVDFGYYDVWLYANDLDNKSPDYEPNIVTPKFIRQSIEFAIHNNWKIERLEIKYRNGEFSLL